MPRTLAQIRQLTAQQLGLLYVSGTADTGGSTTTLKDSILQPYPDDRFNGAHILLTSGSPSDTELQVTDFVSSTGVATFKPTLGASPDTLTYEVLPFSGTDMLRAIVDASLEAYDRGLLVRQHWIRLVAGSPLYNSDWSYWTSSTVVDGWARNGTGTIARIQSGDTGLNETNLRLSTVVDWVGMTAAFQRFLWDFRGYSVILYCPVKTSTGSIARVNLYDGANNYSPYHGGNGSWELLSVTKSISATASSLDIRLVNDGTANVDFGQPFIVGGPVVTEYPFALGTMPDGPDEVRISSMGLQADEVASGRGDMFQRNLGRQLSVSDFSLTKFSHEDSTVQYGILDFTKSRSVPWSQYRMWCLGDGPLTIPSSSTGTNNLEITYSESMLLATMAAMKLLERSMPRMPLSGQAQLRERIARLSRTMNDLAGGVGQARNASSLPLRW